MGKVWRTSGVAQPHTSTRSCRGPKRPISPSSSPPNLSWSSISKPPRRSGSRSRNHCWSEPTRSSNERSVMDRRAFITLVGGSILAAPLAVESQQPAKVPRLGYLVVAPLSETPSPERAGFLSGLQELGWIEGKTIAIEYRSAKWNTELLDDLAEELVRMKVDIILAAGAGPAVGA